MKILLFALLAVQYTFVTPLNRPSLFGGGGILDKIQEARQELREKIEDVIPLPNSTKILTEIKNKFTTTTPKPVELTIWQKIGVKVSEFQDTMKKFCDDNLKRLQEFKHGLDAKIAYLLRIFEKMKRTSFFLVRMTDRLAVL